MEWNHSAQNSSDCAWSKSITIIAFTQIRFYEKVYLLRITLRVVPWDLSATDDRCCFNFVGRSRLGRLLRYTIQICSILTITPLTDYGCNLGTMYTFIIHLLYHSGYAINTEATYRTVSFDCAENIRDGFNQMMRLAYSGADGRKQLKGIFKFVYYSSTNPNACSMHSNNPPMPRTFKNWRYIFQLLTENDNQAMSQNLLIVGPKEVSLSLCDDFDENAVTKSVQFFFANIYGFFQGINQYTGDNRVRFHFEESGS